MSEQKCRNCYYWRPQGPRNDPAVAGVCARRSPYTTGWPTTYGEDWCGEWQVHEMPLLCQEGPCGCGALVTVVEAGGERYLCYRHAAERIAELNRRA